MVRIWAHPCRSRRCGSSATIGSEPDIVDGSSRQQVLTPTEVRPRIDPTALRARAERRAALKRHQSSAPVPVETYQGGCLCHRGTPDRPIPTVLRTEGYWLFIEPIYSTVRLHHVVLFRRHAAVQVAVFRC